MLFEYLKTLEFNTTSKSTIKNTRAALKGLDEFKPLDEVTKDDIIEYFNSIKSSYAENTIILKKNIIKKFYRDIGKPDVVDWMKISAIQNQLDEDDILSIDDVNLLINSTDSHMYKAMIALMFETGGRIGEILNIKVSDIVDDKNEGMTVRLENIKTKKHSAAKHRKNLLLFSAQYLRNWLAYGNLKYSDFVFSIQQPAVWRFLKRTAKRAGITKPVSAHKFRHAQATDMVRRNYQESIIRKKLGWTGDSKQIDRYIHALDNDVIEATRAANGELIVQKSKLPNVKTTEAIEVANTDTIVQEQALRLGELEDQNKILLEKMVSLEMLQGLIQENLNMKPLLEAQAMLHPEEYESEDIRPDMLPTTDKSVEEIEEMKNIDIEKFDRNIDKEYYRKQSATPKQSA